jgi:diguanylate cyclase (GGDEF)-like protein/PAS domain S-box-containing protein
MRDEQLARLIDARLDAIPLDQSQLTQLLYLLDNAPELVFVRDPEGRFTYLNKIGARQFGVDQDSVLATPVTLADVMSAEEIQQIVAEEEAFFTDPKPVTVEARFISHNGGPRWYHGTKVPLLDVEGKVTGVAGIFRDVTELRRQDKIRRDHAHLLEMIARGHSLHSILDAIVRTVESYLDKVFGSILLFDSQEQKLNHGAAPNLPESYSNIIDGVQIGPKVGSCGTAAYRREPVYVSDTFQDALWEDFVELAMRHGLRSCWSTPVISVDDTLLGTFALYTATVREPTDVDREVIDMATNLIGIAIDRSRAHDQAQFLAHHDPLTGLFNRNLFWPQFSRAIDEAKREERLVAITYIDLDNFKQINDGKGHAAGDKVLTSVADRIKGSIRTCDVAVRLGGDEFAIIFSNPTHDKDGMMARLEAIRQSISAPVSYEGEVLDVTCSIGAAFFEGGDDTPEDLLAMADAAMYSAKNSGRNQLKFFDPSQWQV